MSAQSPTQIELITQIEGAMRIAKAEGLAETAYILQMAWIDATARIHSVSEEELSQFFFALESKVQVLDHISPLELQAKKHS